MSIQSTKDYSIFKKHVSNRELTKPNIQRLIASIQSRNLLEFRPIIVNSHMEVIDGQHRLEAAKFLNVEIYYKIDAVSEMGDILLLNINQKTWGLDDYLKYYLSIKSEEYIKLKTFMTNQKIDIRQALRLINQSSSYGFKCFKSGRFKFPTETDFMDMMTLIESFHEVIALISNHKVDGKHICVRCKFKDVLLEFLRIPELKIETFKKKLLINLDKVRVCANSGEYHNMFKQIYNWNNHNPLE